LTQYSGSFLPLVFYLFRNIFKHPSLGVLIQKIYLFGKAQSLVGDYNPLMPTNNKKGSTTNLMVTCNLFTYS